MNGFVILDAGDALADSPMIPAERLENARKTAEFIVDRFNAEGVGAQLIGDRDVGLGRDFLVALSKRARYPWLATNLVDTVSKAPLFASHVVIDVGGVRVGVMGLLSTSTGRSGAYEQAGLELAPLVPAAQAALQAMDKEGAELIVALSQLTPSDEETVAKAVPGIQLFVGGDQVQSDSLLKAVGQALSATGGQKGKQLALLAVEFEDAEGSRAALFDPGWKDANARKVEEARQRIGTYEQLLRETQPTPEAGSGAVAQPTRDAYERQLAAARAELALAESAAKERANEGSPRPRNSVMAELVQLGRAVADDPAVLKLVEEFRKVWPDATPGH